MSETPAYLAEKLKAEGEKVAAFFDSLSEDQWKREVYTEGTVWTIRSVLSHFVTAERGFLLVLFPNVRAGGGGASEDFSIDRFNARQQEKMREATAAQLLAQYRSIRAGMVEWVAGLEEAELDKRGRHPFLGPTTLLEMIKMVYIHNQLHYRDVRRALRP